MNESYPSFEEEIDCEAGVIIYAIGLCHASVCAPNYVTEDALLDIVNRYRPTGIKANWIIAVSKKFRSGQTNPCRCEIQSDRLHYLLEC